MLFLDKLKPGQTAFVEAVNGQDAIVQRLCEMGLLEGTVVEVIGFAPLGDPIEIRLQDFRLSLRRSEAARVQVRLANMPAN
jgi:ferrous iron transport protein A